MEAVVDLQGVGNNVQEHYNVVVSYRGSISSSLVTVIPRIPNTGRGEGRVRIRVLDIGLSARPGRTKQTNRALVRYLEFITLPPSNELPSQAGKKSVFDIKASLLTFLPLSTISHDAQAIQEKYLAPIQTRVDGSDYPPALRKQYKLQLEHIKAQAPSHEIILLPSIAFSLGERHSLGNRPSPADPHPNST